MHLRLRTLLLLVVAALAAAVAGCGGGGSSASSSTDVNQLLKDTFSGQKKVDSGQLNLSLQLNLQGGASSQLNGPISLKLTGPFQSQGKGKLPKFAMTAAVQGGGQNLTAGLTSTGTQAFVNFKGTDYAVSDQVFQQFKTGYEQAQSQAQAKNKNQSLATLGIDPNRWLTNPRNEGDAKVGDTDVIKITGDVDVSKLLDDVNNALDKARSLGVQGTSSIPGKLTDQQRQQIQQAIKSLKVEIYTGKDDKTLRRMLINLDLQTPKTASGGGESGTVALDFSLLDLNQSQDIKAPAAAKPFDQLLGQLGSLGLGGSSGSSSGSGSSSTGGASSAQLKQYADCVKKAGSDTAKAQKCADLLSSP